MTSWIVCRWSKAPTLVTVGELDMCLPPYFSRELADGIPDAELVVFPGGSHLFGMQDPETFNRVTLDWLARQQRIRRSSTEQAPHARLQPTTSVRVVSGRLTARGRLQR